MPNAADLDLIRSFCKRGVLPVPGSATRQALELAHDDLSNNDELIAQIESDARLEFGFLACANLPPATEIRCNDFSVPPCLSVSPSLPASPYSRPVTSTRQAVTELGRVRCLSLLWLIALFEFVRAWPQRDQRIRDRLAMHSLLTGLLANQMLSATGLGMAGDALAAGMAHDIGHLLVAGPIPRLGLLSDEEPDQLVETALSPSPERDHCRLGATLLTIWNAPVEVVASTLHHHEPTLAESGVRPLVVAVRLADLIAEHFDLNRPGPPLPLDAAPAWRQLAAVDPWNCVPHLHLLALQRLPETIILVRHLARTLHHGFSRYTLSPVPK